MFGKCPKCQVSFRKEELKNLKNGSSARCYKCGKVYMSKPFWIYCKFYSMPFLVFVVPMLGVKPLTIVSCVTGLLIAALFHDIQVYLPLMEDKNDDFF